MISGRKNAAKVYQGVSTRHQHNAHHAFEDQIYLKAGVVCTVKVLENEISIRTKNYPDFVLAMAAIKGMTDLPVTKSFMI